MNSPRNSHFLPGQTGKPIRDDVDSASIRHSSVRHTHIDPGRTAPGSDAAGMDTAGRISNGRPASSIGSHHADTHYSGTEYSNNQYSNNQYSNNQYSNNQYSNNQYANTHHSDTSYSNVRHPDKQPPDNNYLNPPAAAAIDSPANQEVESTTIPQPQPSSTKSIHGLYTKVLTRILGLNDRINHSKAIDNPFVQRLDGWLLPFFRWSGLSRLLDTMSGHAHSIVAQSNKPLKEESYWHYENYALEEPEPHPESRPVSTATRMGFVALALLLLAGGWSLINGPATNAISSSDGLLSGNSAQGITSQAQATFAVINPANVDANALQMNVGAEVGNLPIGTDEESSSGVRPLAAIAAAMSRESEIDSDDVENGPTTGNQLTNQLRDLAIGASNGDDGSEASANKPKTIGQIALAQRATDTPADAPTPTITPTPTEEEIPVDVPQLKLIPMVARPSALPADTATPTPTITPTPLPIEPGGLWSTFIPGPPSEVDHFWLGRPFLPSERNQLASTNYQFGSSAYGRYRIHHGLDMSNPIGTSVLAATDGEVTHAGPDDPVLLAPFNNFYGNSVVIRLDKKLNIAGSDIDVFVLFGHLTSVSVEVGQRVSPQDIVGTVGMTGIAIGPHLHIEVRVGSNSYDTSVNPYLWMQPRDGTGVVAVRLLTADGRTWPGGRVSLIGQDVRFSRTIEIYLADEPLGPDPRFGENGAIGSVPPGSYLLAGSVNGERFRKEITVNAGETTFAEIRTQQ